VKETADAADTSQAATVEGDRNRECLRGTLRNFGLKVGMVGKVKFEARIRELVENLPVLAVLVEPPLIVRRTLREQIVILHRRLLAIVRDDEVCRRRAPKYQSGEVDRNGRSRCGDEMMRVMLYEAAQSMLMHSKKWSWLKAWAMQIARRRGLKKAIVALARLLAVIMHRIWVDGAQFRWTREQAAAAA
jgi:transposase